MDLALADCNVAIELKPGYIKALLRRASILEAGAAEDWDRALRDYEEVLQLEPHNGFARAAALVSCYGMNELTPGFCDDALCFQCLRSYSGILVGPGCCQRPMFCIA